MRVPRALPCPAPTMRGGALRTAFLKPPSGDTPTCELAPSPAPPRQPAAAAAAAWPPSAQCAHGQGNAPLDEEVRHAGVQVKVHGGGDGRVGAPPRRARQGAAPLLRAPQREPHEEAAVGAHRATYLRTTRNGWPPSASAPALALALALPLTTPTPATEQASPLASSFASALKSASASAVVEVGALSSPPTTSFPLPLTPPGRPPC